MNKYLKIMPLTILATVALTLSSCSDDNDDPKNGDDTSYVQPSTKNVFTSGVPANVDGATITTNANGQVISIKDDETTVTFEYGTFTPSRADHNFTVLMKERDIDHEGGFDMYMELNKDGFVVYAYEVYVYDDGYDEWTFDYDKDGHMTRMVRSESDDEYVITWTDGNLTKVVNNESGYHSEYTIEYTNSQNKTAIENKGCLMLFEDNFRIDIDEMGIAYYAGLLGKSTKNLPMALTEKYTEGGSTHTFQTTFHWQFNSNNLPVKYWDDDEPEHGINFVW